MLIVGIFPIFSLQLWCELQVQGWCELQVQGWKKTEKMHAAHSNTIVAYRGTGYDAVGVVGEEEFLSGSCCHFWWKLVDLCKTGFQPHFHTNAMINSMMNNNN